MTHFRNSSSLSAGELEEVADASDGELELTDFVVSPGDGTVVQLKIGNQIVLEFNVGFGAITFANSLHLRSGLRVPKGKKLKARLSEDGRLTVLGRYI